MIGKTLGHYRIIKKIGAGGMGEVYLAEDQHLQRDVAIKVLPAGLLSDDSARRRFRAEALAVSKLSHPNIGTVFDFDTQDGIDFLVMEFIAGQTLSEKLRPGPLSDTETARLGSQMADGLAAAHAAGIVHRDLKPGNLMITPDGRLKILDFGLAKLLAPASGEDATRSVTETRGVAGTLPYMAPEQLLGQAVDGRTDIHAAGAVLYEMASGRRPFQQDTIPGLTDAILHQTPVGVRAFNAAVSPALEGIILRCLEKDADMRYGSAHELALDLRRLGAPTRVAAESEQGHRRRRRVGRWAAALVVVLAAAILAAVLLRTSHGPSGQRLSTGARASSSAEANEYFEKAMLFMMSQFDLPRARQMLERALALDADFAAARAEFGFTHVLMVDGGWANDTSWLYKAEEDIRRVVRDAPDSSRAHSALAAIYFYMGRKELAPAEAEKALSLNPNDLDGYVWLVNYYILNEDYARAETYVREALQRAPLFFPGRMNLGEVLRLKGDLAGARREQEKILEQDPQNIYAIRFLARVFTDAGDVPAVRRTLERGRAEDRKNYKIRIAWALLLALEGKRSEATKEMDEEVLKYAAIAFDETQVAAQVYAVLGETSRAIDWLDRAVRNGDERAGYFRHDPAMASIRSQPRFQQIVDSITIRRQQQGK